MVNLLSPGRAIIAGELVLESLRKVASRRSTRATISTGRSIKFVYGKEVVTGKNSRLDVPRVFLVNLF